MMSRLCLGGVIVAIGSYCHGAAWNSRKGEPGGRLPWMATGTAHGLIS
jgi:hypothetical protein